MYFISLYACNKILTGTGWFITFTGHLQHISSHLLWPYDSNNYMYGYNSTTCPFLFRREVLCQKQLKIRSNFLINHSDYHRSRVILYKPAEFGHLSLRHGLILGQLGRIRSYSSGKSKSCEIAEKSLFFVRMRYDSSERLYWIIQTNYKLLIEEKLLCRDRDPLRSSNGKRTAHAAWWHDTFVYNGNTNVALSPNNT